MDDKVAGAEFSPRLNLDGKRVFADFPPACVRRNSLLFLKTVLGITNAIFFA